MEQVIVMNAKDAIRDMKELLTLALGDVGTLDKVNQFLELGLASFVIAKSDSVTAEGTEKIFTLYKLADPLVALLLAARASKVNTKVSQ